jgi:hypothetical protein
LERFMGLRASRAVLQVVLDLQVPHEVKFPVDEGVNQVLGL